MRVERITLFIFGGIAHAGGEFETAGDEFLVAAAGPVSSLIIAALFWVTAYAAGALGAHPAATAVVAWLAAVMVAKLSSANTIAIPGSAARSAGASFTASNDRMILAGDGIH